MKLGAGTTGNEGVDSVMGLIAGIVNWPMNELVGGLHCGSTMSSV
jgi:hypothetical protein